MGEGGERFSKPKNTADAHSRNLAPPLITHRYTFTPSPLGGGAKATTRGGRASLKSPFAFLPPPRKEVGGGRSGIPQPPLGGGGWLGTAGCGSLPSWFTSGRGAKKTSTPRRLALPSPKGFFTQPAPCPLQAFFRPPVLQGGGGLRGGRVDTTQCNHCHSRPHSLPSLTGGWPAGHPLRVTVGCSNGSCNRAGFYGR